ncbi:MAG: hypothetical protein FWE66_01255 [Oscillospiraceae bacterium]|nr:hypothetical protein [Oscillospiraceae bacterium]
MKRSTLIAIIIGLVALLSALVGALYVLKKRGILFNDDDYEYEFDDYSDDESASIDIDLDEPVKKVRRVLKKTEAQPEEASDDN